jgi:hypothetical protein
VDRHFEPARRADREAVEVLEAISGGHRAMELDRKYLLSLEVIGVLTCLVLYLPFALKDWRAARQVQAAA